MDKYGGEAWIFLRNYLKLPLDFSYIFVNTSGVMNSFHFIRYYPRGDYIKHDLIDLNTTTEIKVIDDTGGYWTQKRDQTNMIQRMEGQSSITGY